ncbi:MAG: class I SAM-dependent methyltransferase [Chitinophagaceae bacterium]|nr:class I SAM-dependent methyltransferase [Chitinophagaceae bacterium]
MAKDLFSNQSDLYARYRPTYPQELFDYILSFVNEKNLAWDCATGNGQAATILSTHFKKVIATDISTAQLSKAVQKENIEYVVCPAESTSFDENIFDLVTVAQAYHWLKWSSFKEEVTRVAKPRAVLAVWMYGGHRTDDVTVNKAVRSFHKNITGPYWDNERRHVDDNYATVEFNYELLPAKEFTIQLSWQREDLLGYISTWSALQKYEAAQGHSALPFIKREIENLWLPGEVKKVIFPVYLKLGRITK